MDYLYERIQIAKTFKKESLTLSQAGLKKIPEAVFELTELKSLNLIRNELTTIPKAISKLKKLEELYLSANNIKKLPKEIGTLKHLKTLIINSCNVEQISDHIGDLEHLEFLDLRFNNLENLPYSLGKLKKLSTLLIRDNTLSDIPPEIPLQSTQVILDYLRSKLKGETEQLFEAKLIIVGEGEVGKTWLKERLIYDEIISNNIHNSTEGIDISKWNLPTDVSKNFRINLWDFGGQEIYHSTHQFFLTERSLYLLVFDARKDSDVTSFGYWLKTIKLLSSNAPIIIVLNKIDERRKDIDIEAFQEQFNIVGFSKISALNGKGRKKLVKQIESHIVNLEHVGQELPKNWVAVRTDLEKLKSNFISYERYINICHNHEINEELARELSHYYHILGVFLHFHDNPILKGMVFLNPVWATTAVYKVLDHAIIEAHQGKFNLSHLPEIWQNEEGYPEENYVHLLELMKKFELCFQLPNNNWFIIPAKLPSVKPKIEWDYQENLLFEFKYEFMPAGIMTRLIVRLHEIIKDNLFWKSGVVLEETTYIHSQNSQETAKKLNTTALIIANEFDRKIVIHITGDEKRELLSLIRRQINAIHKSLKFPQVTELITCCCSECLDDQFPEQIDFNRVKQFNYKNVPSFPCPRSGEQVHVSQLLGDFELTNEPIYEEIVSLLKQIKNQTDSEQTFLEKANEVIMLQPNIAGLGLDFNKLIEKFISKKPSK